MVQAGGERVESERLEAGEHMSLLAVLAGGYIKDFFLLRYL